MTSRYMGMNPQGTGTLSDADHVWQSVSDILQTPIGSRVMRRTYGSLIPDLIDNPQNAVLRMQLMSAIVIALAAWETRIVLSEVDVVFSETAAVSARLSGTLTESMEPQSTTITLRSNSNGNS
ncbi:GPW/gp25 family protein [Citrobacter freundii]|uniref:GPW/gp25 family protein n=1 Tax=Citrobacter freundii TaxID=546 RepID=UPI0018FFFC33|nr:GPW/gp25 family protein [Citrobacter freundii]MBJ8767890.1 GPW/gp25 family protein [Citrobacter freundii]